MSRFYGKIFDKTFGGDMCVVKVGAYSGRKKDLGAGGIDKYLKWVELGMKGCPVVLSKADISSMKSSLGETLWVTVMSRMTVITDEKGGEYLIREWDKYHRDSGERHQAKMELIKEVNNE